MKFEIDASEGAPALNTQRYMIYGRVGCNESVTTGYESKSHDARSSNNYLGLAGLGDAHYASSAA